MRSFADYLDAWSDLPEPPRPVRTVRRSVDEYGEGVPFRSLSADELAEQGQRTELAPALADRMERVAREWRTVADRLDEILERDESPPVIFEEAASLVGDVADCEEATFGDLRDELRHVDD